MGKVAKSILIGWLVACVSCASTPRPRPAVKVDPSEAVKASNDLIEACIDPPPPAVPCSIDKLEAVDMMIHGLGQALAEEQEENRHLRSAGALDLQAEQARAAELQRKLDSPWRSWWLWAMIGGAVVAAVLTGAYWGANPQSQAPLDFARSLPDRPGF